MIEGIWNVLPSRIRFAMAGVESRISRAATRPPPSFLHSVCAITPLSDSDNITRICDCRSAVNWSIMRSTVDRMIDQFPADRQSQIRVMLSESLKGVIAQTLCKKVGGGRVAAREILLTT